MICRTKDGRVQVDPAMIGALEGGTLKEEGTIHLCNGTRLTVTNIELEEISLQWFDWDRDQDEDDDDEDPDQQDFAGPIELTEEQPIVFRRRRKRS